MAKAIYIPHCHHTQQLNKDDHLLADSIYLGTHRCNKNDWPINAACIPHNMEASHKLAANMQQSSLLDFIRILKCIWFQLIQECTISIPSLF